MRVPDTKVAPSKAVGLAEASVPWAHDSPVPAKWHFLDLSQEPDRLALSTNGP